MSKRPWPLVAGSALALLIGLAAFMSGIIGFNRPLASADGITAWPNLLTGAVSIVAAIGFWSLRKWSIYVYVVALACHVLTQIMLYFGRNATGRTVPPTAIAFLAVVPLLSLAILTDIEFHRRKGILS